MEQDNMHPLLESGRREPYRWSGVTGGAAWYIWKAQKGGTWNGSSDMPGVCEGVNVTGLDSPRAVAEALCTYRYLRRWMESRKPKTEKPPTTDWEAVAEERAADFDRLAAAIEMAHEALTDKPHTYTDASCSDLVTACQKARRTIEDHAPTKRAQAAELRALRAENGRLRFSLSAIADSESTEAPDPTETPAELACRAIGVALSLAHRVRVLEAKNRQLHAKAGPPDLDTTPF